MTWARMTSTPSTQEATPPLALAVQFRRPEAVLALLEAGANPNPMNDGWSILATAVYEESRPARSTAFVEVLLAAGADVNPPGYPSLFCALNQEWSSGTVLAQVVSAAPTSKRSADGSPRPCFTASRGSPMPIWSTSR
jgi:ankyrin repeat protein